ncbi:odorant receptor 67c-like [Coccinella septempunctata]|uniref:odorant receptor 67c-like n=1 Tax=Coccinella septempunctata TaxID=41139 RepID=UPI001D06D6A3|nr:odorant receptor 67c-like [Coccinella septempunctata]
MFERSKISLTTTTNHEIQDVGFKSMERWKKWFEIFVGVNVMVSVQVTIESMMERKPFIMAYLEDEKANDLLYCLLVILINVIFMLSTITTVLGYEGTFIYFIAYSVAEIKMVKLALKSYRFTSKEGRETFNKILDHHVHTLNFIQDVSDSYSFILLCQYLTSLTAVCFALFLMTLDGMPPDLDHITRYGNLSVTYLLQLAILCIAGDILTNECSGIGDIMFHKDWDENLVYRNSFAMASVMMIQRTQKSAALSIGGFTELNLESFGEVVKSAMSFLTFMQTVYEEKGGNLSK